MKKSALVVAVLVSLGLVGSVFASPASAFFFGGSGNQNCGQSYYGPGGGTPGLGLPGFRGLGFGPRGVGGPGGGGPGFGGPGAGYGANAYWATTCNAAPAACKPTKKGKKAKAGKK
jgi:hypothetical protein